MLSGEYFKFCRMVLHFIEGKATILEMCTTAKKIKLAFRIKPKVYLLAKFVRAHAENGNVLHAVNFIVLSLNKKQK